MLMLPLPAQPDWRRLPYLTLLLICACFVVFVLQGRDWNHSQEAMRFYRDSSLAAVELPAYVTDLARRDPEHAAPLDDALRKKAFSEVWRAMEGDADFMARLEAEQVISPGQDIYRRWQDDRRLYTTLRARNLTEKLAFKAHAPALTDFLTHAFPGAIRLLELSHSLEELKTICRCGRKAIFNARKLLVPDGGEGEFVFEGGQVAIDGVQDPTGLAGPAAEQITDIFVQPMEQNIVKALPVNALYSRAIL